MSFSPSKPQPQKDGEGEPRNQVLGKRIHSPINSDRDAQHFVADQSDSKIRQAYQEWQHAWRAANAAN